MQISSTAGGAGDHVTDLGPYLPLQNRWWKVSIFHINILIQPLALVTDTVIEIFSKHTHHLFTLKHESAPPTKRPLSTAKAFSHAFWQP